MPPPAPPPLTPMDLFWQAPPFTRTITALTLTISVLVYSSLLNGSWVVFYVSAFLKIPPQLWRFFTCFMLSRPQLSIIFDPYFMYVYGSKLETASPRFAETGDFAAYIIFICVTILGLNMAFTGSGVMTSALILAFVYTACQDERAGKSTFYFITVPTTWIPLAMLFVTFIIDGSYIAQVQGTGLVAAHLHDFLTKIYPTFGGGRNILETPAFLKRFFANPMPSVITRAYGTAIKPGQDPRQSSSSGSSASNVLPEAWKSRGSGHRLGGD